MKGDIIFSEKTMKKEKEKLNETLETEITLTEASPAEAESEKKPKKEKKEKTPKPEKVKPEKAEKVKAEKPKKEKVKKEKKQKVKYKFSSPSKAEKIGIAVTFATIFVVVGLGIFLSFFLYLVY